MRPGRAGAGTRGPRRQPRHGLSCGSGRRRHVHRFLRIRRAHQRPSYPEGALHPGPARRRGHGGHRGAREALRRRARERHLLHPRHHGGRKHGDPAQGREAVPLHHHELRGRPRSGAAQDAGPLRSAFPAPRPPGVEGPGDPRQRAHARRRHRGPAGRRGERRGGAGARARDRRRGHRGRLHQRVPQPRERTRREGHDRAPRPGAAGLLLERRVVHHPRVRTHHHRRHPRLRAAPRGALPRPPCSAPSPRPGCRPSRW